MELLNQLTGFLQTICFGSLKMTVEETWKRYSRRRLEITKAGLTHRTLEASKL